MKKQLSVVVCALLLVAVCAALLCACGYTYNERKNALIYVPDVLPDGVEKVEVQPKSPDDKIVEGQGGVAYIERGVEYRVVMYLLHDNDIGTLGVKICGEEYRWSLMLDSPYGKRYWVTGLTVPKSGDITVEISGAPVSAL